LNEDNVIPSFRHRTFAESRSAWLTLIPNI
jgi:hypothetical protein